jgi:hypothetical protein
MFNRNRGRIFLFHINSYYLNNRQTDLINNITKIINDFYYLKILVLGFNDHILTLLFNKSINNYLVKTNITVV